MFQDGSMTGTESRRRRLAFGGLAVAGAAAFLWFAAQYLVTAHGGTDQNGYLVGGRLLAEHGSMALRPVNPVTGVGDPFLFVGRMWVGVDLNGPEERYYPKYPMGLPALVAVAWKLGGPAPAYWISPLCMTLALLAVFLLARAVAGSFLGWIALLLVGSSPITLTLAGNPNSHASTLFMVAWGMVLLFDWSRQGGQWRALAAGLLIGYAATIRYTEGLLLLPLLLAAWWRFRDRPADRTVFLLPAAWSLPILMLVAHNRWAFGAWTGYDPCNESSGFAWAYFRDNWGTMLHQLGGVGLIFFFPLGLAGLVFMIWRARRLGLFMAAWIVPNVLAYTFYYWAPDGLGYLRFFLTVLPPLAICGMWLLHVMGEGLHAGRPGLPPPHRHPSVSIAAGGLALLTVTANLHTATEAMASDFLARAALQRRVNDILGAAPPGSVLFSPDSSLLHCLQFQGSLVLYSQSSFDRKALESLPDIDLDAPQSLQPQRSLAIRERFGGLTQTQLAQQQRSIAESALSAGRRVFALRRTQPTLRKPAGRPAGTPEWTVPGTFPASEFDQTLVCSWADVPLTPQKPAPARPRGRKIDAPRPDPRGTAWWLVEITARPRPVPSSRRPAKTRE